MQLRHLKNLSPGVDGLNRVSASAWSPNNMRLAVVTADRVVRVSPQHNLYSLYLTVSFVYSYQLSLTCSSQVYLSSGDAIVLT